jgi:Flp pilus assembly protein CpaB
MSVRFKSIVFLHLIIFFLFFAAAQSSAQVSTSILPEAQTPNAALIKEDVVDAHPINPIDIPAGYKLVTILIDNMSGVDGWPKPGTRVDVIWTFVKEGRKKIASPLVRFAKVISINEDTGGQNKEKITENAEKKLKVLLLVTERQSQFIEVAKGTGELSLALVDGAEPPPDVDDHPHGMMLLQETTDGSTLTREDQDKQANIMYSSDPITKRKTKYILANGSWNIDKTYKE